MGAWATGIFENDGALDFLGNVIEQFSSYLDEYFSEPIEDQIMYSLYYESGAGPLIALMNIVCKSTEVCPPEPKKIVEWKELFFKKYSKYSPAGWSEEDSETRRKLFEKEFDEMISYATKYYSN